MTTTQPRRPRIAGVTATRSRPTRVEVLEHAKIVQATIARLGGHALPLRGTAASIATAASAAALSGHAAAAIVLPAIVVVLAIGAMDGYYLWQERLYRALYNAVILGGVPWLSMDIRPYRPTCRYWRAALSRTVLAVYLPLAGVLAVAGVL